MDRRQTDAGRLPHVDGALLRQVHVVEVDELELGLFFGSECTGGATVKGVTSVKTTPIKTRALRILHHICKCIKIIQKGGFLFIFIDMKA